MEVATSFFAFKQFTLVISILWLPLWNGKALLHNNTVVDSGVNPRKRANWFYYEENWHLSMIVLGKKWILLFPLEIKSVFCIS